MVGKDLELDQKKLHNESTGMVVKSPTTLYILAGLRAELKTEEQKIEYVVNEMRKTRQDLTLGKLIDLLRDRSHTFTNEHLNLAQTIFRRQERSNVLKKIDEALERTDITEGEFVDLLIEWRCDDQLLALAQQRFRAIREARKEASIPKTRLALAAQLLFSSLLEDQS